MYKIEIKDYIMVRNYITEDTFEREPILKDERAYYFYDYDKAVKFFVSHMRVYDFFCAYCIEGKVLNVWTEDEDNSAVVSFVGVVTEEILKLNKIIAKDLINIFK